MYDYIEQELNRPIAEKLILELFLGRKMVPRKQIIKEIFIKKLITNKGAKNGIST